ncbi:MAG: hypothetical protein JWN65_2502 [Solirubrobacterales bacterium]|jgi:hypothetical protein|nr:hypothetical protein [Solirubrobacterales bacterium]
MSTTITHRKLALATTVAALAAGAPLAGAATTTTLKAAMTGKAEVPGPADANGKGTATVKVTGTKVCYTLSYSNIATPNASHIHRGAAGKAGPVVVPLFTGKPKKSACVTTTAKLAKEIAQKPASFYVNVHDKAFPNGAIRGQLHK